MSVAGCMVLLTKGFSAVHKCVKPGHTVFRGNNLCQPTCEPTGTTRKETGFGVAAKQKGPNGGARAHYACEIGH